MANFVYPPETGGEGADTDLSNLTSPTAINENLQFDSDNTYTVGDSTNQVSTVYTNSVVNDNGDLSLFADSNNIDVGFCNIINLAEPTSSAHAATKNYVDNLSIGLSWKNPVQVATTANIALSGEQTIDGVLTSGSRVLVKDQIDQFENGIYVSAAGAWSRSSDANTASELEAAAVFVEEGTINADLGFVQTSDNITVGTTNLVWVQFTASASSFANVTLSNLQSPTSINQDLRPDTGFSRNLGSSSRHWAELHIGNLVYAGAVAFDLANKVLKNDAEVDMITFSGSDVILNSKRITSLANPINPQDAATKTYVDSNFANKTLSNLTSPTSINQDLLPNTTNNFSIGSSTLRYSATYATDSNAIAFDIRNAGFTGLTGDINGNSTTIPSGATSVLNFRTLGSTARLSIFSSNNSNADAVATASINIESGNKTAGTGNSGDINIITGTSFGGTRGIINLNASSVSMNSSKITSLADPTAAQDAATKAYADTKIPKYDVQNINTNTNAVVFTLYTVDTSGGSVTVTLPATHAEGDTITVKDGAGSAATNNIIVDRNGDLIDNTSSNRTISSNFGSETYVSNGTNWFVI